MTLKIGIFITQMATGENYSTSSILLIYDSWVKQVSFFRANNWDGGGQFMQFKELFGVTMPVLMLSS